MRHAAFRVSESHAAAAPGEHLRPAFGPLRGRADHIKWNSLSIYVSR